MGDAEPQGPCGSGLVDAVAELVALKLLDSSGYFVPDDEALAIALGVGSRLPVMHVISAGTVAGEGAKMALLSLRERVGAMAWLKEVEFVELSDRPLFNDRFVDQLPFPV